jgi:predicted ATP-dependent endonuclease of OLD family
VPTGLLSDKQRAFLRDEREDITNPDQYENQLRHQANQRVSQMAEDLDLLEKHGHEDIVAKFYYEVDKIERLRKRMESETNATTEEDGEG